MTSVLKITIQHEDRAYMLEDREKFLTYIRQACQQRPSSLAPLSIKEGSSLSKNNLIVLASLLLAASLPWRVHAGILLVGIKSSRRQKGHSSCG